VKILTLAEMRKERGFTQDQLCKKLRVDQTTISTWECGIRKPLAKNIKKLAKVFGCSQEEIIAACAENKGG